MSAVSPARKAAFAILLAVERGHSHSDDLLRGRSVEALSPADRNLATALVLGTLRWQIALDHQLKTHLKHPNAKLDAEVLIALRMGAFQLLHMDRIPARAAIDESVELTKQAGHHFASGMVNAVLRKITKNASNEDLKARLRRWRWPRRIRHGWLNGGRVSMGWRPHGRFASMDNSNLQTRCASRILPLKRNWQETA